MLQVNLTVMVLAMVVEMCWFITTAEKTWLLVFVCSVVHQNQYLRRVLTDERFDPRVYATAAGVVSFYENGDCQLDCAPFLNVLGDQQV